MKLMPRNTSSILRDLRVYPGTQRQFRQAVIVVVGLAIVSFLTGCGGPAMLTGPAQAGTFGSYKIMTVLPPIRASYNSYASDCARQYVIGSLAEIAVRESISAGSRAGGQSQVNAISKKLGPFEQPLILSEVQKAFAAAGYNYQPNAKGVFMLGIMKYGLYKNKDDTVYAQVFGCGTLKNSTGKLFVLGRGSSRWGLSSQEGRSQTPRRLEDYSTNPQLYKDDIAAAAESFAKALVPGSNVTTPQATKSPR